MFIPGFDSLRPDPFSDENILDTFIESAKNGDLGNLVLCLDKDAHKKDLRGSALYYATAYGHESCVKELIRARVAITSKHYFAAGQAHELKRVVMYNLLSQEFPYQDLQRFHDESNDFRTNDWAKIQEMVPRASPARQATWLRFSLFAGDIQKTRALLCLGVTISSEHFFDAAITVHKDKDTVRQSLYKLLKEVQDGTLTLKQVKADFMTQYEIDETEKPPQCKMQ